MKEIDLYEAESVWVLLDFVIWTYKMFPTGLERGLFWWNGWVYQGMPWRVVYANAIRACSCSGIYVVYYTYFGRVGGERCRGIRALLFFWVWKLTEEIWLFFFGKETDILFLVMVSCVSGSSVCFFLSAYEHPSHGTISLCVRVDDKCLFFLCSVFRCRRSYFFSLLSVCILLIKSGEGKRHLSWDLVFVLLYWNWVTKLYRLCWGTLFGFVSDNFGKKFFGWVHACEVGDTNVC